MKVLIAMQAQDLELAVELCREAGLEVTDDLAEADIALFERPHRHAVHDWEGPVVELVCSCCRPGEADHPGAWVDPDGSTVIVLSRFLRGASGRMAA